MVTEGVLGVAACAGRKCVRWSERISLVVEMIRRILTVVKCVDVNRRKSGTSTRPLPLLNLSRYCH